MAQADPGVVPAVAEQTPPFVNVQLANQFLDVCRAMSLWPLTFGLACCAIEMIHTGCPVMTSTASVWSSGRARVNPMS